MVNEEGENHPLQPVNLPCADPLIKPLVYVCAYLKSECEPGLSLSKM